MTVNEIEVVIDTVVGHIGGVHIIIVELHHIISVGMPQMVDIKRSLIQPRAKVGNAAPAIARTLIQCIHFDIGRERSSLKSPGGITGADFFFIFPSPDGPAKVFA